MAGRRRLTIAQLPTELPKLIRDAATHNKAVLVRSIQEWPNRYVRRAKQFYPSVLKRPTGRLIRSFSTLVRRVSDKAILLGLRSNVEYAPVLEFGFSGRVTVPAHLVRRHRVRSHVDRRGRRIPEHFRGPFTRGTHTRMMNIRARYFFKLPILRETVDAVNDLADEIGWSP